MEEEEVRQLEEMKQMNEWRAKQAEKDKIANQPKAKPVKVEDSYTSDDFEDTVSISGSGSSKLPAKPI